MSAAFAALRPVLPILLGASVMLTLSMGLRLVLVVIIPAAVGLLVLGRPIIQLIFEHGAFTPTDTQQSWYALRLYLIGLPFTAIDLPDNVLSKLEKLLKHLQPTARLKWSPPSNLHITTKFIGEWPQERLGEIEADERGGQPVAVVANQPNVLAGSIDADAADKAAHFITVADSFHLPIIFLADNPGMLPGSRSERTGVLRAGARMFAAQTAASTVKLHLTLRKAYGFGSMVMSLLGFDNQVGTFAYPGATMGAMGAAAMSAASHAGEDLAAKLAATELQASYHSAAQMGFDELIDPRETRDVLLSALQRGLRSRQAAAEPVSRIGIMP